MNRFFYFAQELTSLSSGKHRLLVRNYFLPSDKGNKSDAHEEESVDEQQHVIDLLDMPEHIVMVGPKKW